MVEATVGLRVHDQRRRVSIEETCTLVEYPSSEFTGVPYGKAIATIAHFEAQAVTSETQHDTI